jgi:hypothetical protein
LAINVELDRNAGDRRAYHNPFQQLAERVWARSRSPGLLTIRL